MTEPSTLARKLGIKPGSIWSVTNAPASFFADLAPLPEGCAIEPKSTRESEGRIVFAVTLEDLVLGFETALEGLPKTGAIWIAWPKKSSGVSSVLKFETVQSLGLANRLVDNKICAIDTTWTALRFVVPLAMRKDWP